MAEEKPAITTTKDGPYIVTGLKKLLSSKGKQIEVKETIALCRCGASLNKPFCDGTHGKVGFSSKLEADRSKHETVEFKGKELSILDNAGVCAHVGFCDGNLKDVYWEHKDGKRYAFPDKASKEDNIRIIKQCPSGSLAYKIKGKVHDEFDHHPMIRIFKDGPLCAMGSISFSDEESDSKPLSKEHYTLCRCGGSKNKPFCDGQHWYIKFKDEKN